MTVFQIAVTVDQEVASCGAHCGLQGVCGSFVSPGQIHAADGTCADTEIKRHENKKK